MAELIREADVQTMAGLRAKVLVAIVDCKPFSARHDGYFDFDDPVSHWSLFNGAVAVTGLNDFVMELEERLQRDATKKIDA